MNVLPALLLIALIVIQEYTAYAQLAGGRPGLRQQIVRQQQKRDRQEEQRRSDQAAQLQQRMVQRVSRTDPNNADLPGTTVTAPAAGPYLPSDDAAAAGQSFPSVFNGIVGPYSSRSSRAPGGPEFAFGWAPVVLDGSPEEEFDDAWQQPKVWNYRCYKACSSYQMNPMRLYGGNNQPADLCYFNRTRPDGKPYFVAGTWFPGERENRWESTCRGRDANGGPAVQFALGWDKQARGSGCLQLGDVAAAEADWQQSLFWAFTGILALGACISSTTQRVNADYGRLELQKQKNELLREVLRVRQQAAKQQQQLQQFEAVLRGQGSTASSSGSSARCQQWAPLKQQLLSSLSG
ncbi:hypothetical protein OEZ86_008595 [Tetradesmus obliquus]|nr:hypothetical protein OEZ86_008595 [Tetradesmus obliquus]